MRKIWRRSEIEMDKQYVLLLIEGDSGDREFEIREVSQIFAPVNDGRCAYRTKVIPDIDAILRGDIEGISEIVVLENGMKFGFDSNGRWYTEEEEW
jgi:hypothetical protein